MSAPPDDGPSRHSLERAGIRSGGSVGVRIGLFVGALGAIGAVVAIAWQGGRPAASTSDDDPDAGTAMRPIEIGMPVIIARSGGAAEPGDVEDPAARQASARLGAGTLPPRGGARTGSQGPPESPTAAVAPAATATAAAPREPEAARAGEAGEPAPVRTIVADDSPAARAAAVAYQVNARAAVQREYLGQVQSCFQQAAQVDPSVSGSITIGFVTADDGRVLGSRVVGDTTGREVGACVSAAARSWRLPPPPRNALELQMSFAL